MVRRHTFGGGAEGKAGGSDSERVREVREAVHMLYAGWLWEWKIEGEKGTLRGGLVVRGRGRRNGQEKEE